MQEYGYAAGAGLHPSCEREVITQLLDLHRQRAEYASRDGRVAADEYFYAEQNARLVKNAEEYYRTMFRGREESWNLRDQHMAATLQELLRFLDRSHTGARIVVSMDFPVTRSVTATAFSSRSIPIWPRTKHSSPG